MAPLMNMKEVQSLNGKVAALNRFVLRAIDKCLPFFRMLKKSFEWIAECQQAFEDLKAYLSSPSLLSPSKLGKEMFLYLAVSRAVVSAAFVREEAHVLHQPGNPWCWGEVPIEMEKLAFAFVTTARKLKPYF